MSISDRELGRLEYAEEISLLDAGAVRNELDAAEREVEDLQHMIMIRYGGLRELASAAKGWPAALELQQRFKAAALRRIELRRRAGETRAGEGATCP